MRKPAAAFMILGITSIVTGTIALAGHLDSVSRVTGSDARRAAMTAIEAAGPGWAVLNRDSHRTAVWEVRVTRSDGSVVDVRMDDRFHVIDMRAGQPVRHAPASDVRASRARAAAPAPASGSELAARAALDAVGGGRVDVVDRDAEDGATWEVEVMKNDGRRIEVQLNDRYRVMNVGPERERDVDANDRDENPRDDRDDEDDRNERNDEDDRDDPDHD